MTEKGVGRRKPLTCRRSGVLGIVRDYQRPIVIMRGLLLSFGWYFMGSVLALLNLQNDRILRIVFFRMGVRSPSRAVSQNREIL
jgi:hypothetical protein